MLVKYKTILYGEKPYCEKTIDGKPSFNANEPCKYKVFSHDFCCDEMKDCIRGGHPLSFSDYVFPEPYYSIYIPDGYGEGDSKEVKFCPFCGKKIEYKEVERTKYKKIKSFDYKEIKE